MTGEAVSCCYRMSYIVSMAEAQTVNGVRVRSKIVPPVTEVRPPHPEHMNRPSPSRQPPERPQPGQTKPAGHRNHSR